MANRYWVGGTGAWSDVSTANWSTTTGLSFTASCTGTVLTTTGSPALVAGMTVWSAVHTSLGTIISGAVNTWVVSVGGTYALQNMSAATVGASVPTASDSVFFDANSNSSTSSFTVTMSVTPRVCNDFTASGLDGTMTLAGVSIALSVSGSLTFQSTNFARSFTGGITFNATTTGKTITTNGVTLGNTTIFNGVGGYWTLGSALTANIGNPTINLTNGTIDLSSYTLTTGNFTSSNSNTRTIAFGTGQITITGTSTTIWNLGVITGLTTTGNQVVNSTATTGTRVFVLGSLSEANSISFNISASASAVQFLNNASETVKNVDFTGYAGTLAATSNVTIYGNLTLSTGMTLTTSASAMTFGATSGTQQITTNAKTINFPLTFNGIGGTFQLQDALTMGSTRTATLTNGTLDLFGKTLTVGTRFTTATGTKNLTFNGGTLVCPDPNTTSFNNASPTNFTTTAGTGTGTISMTAATAKTFVGGGSTFNCTLNQGGAGALTITGSNTFNDITNTVQPASVLFTAGTTSTFSNFNLSGTSGNLITIGSVTAASHTLSKASGTVSSDYLSISQSTATGGAGWYAGANSTNGGNNSGWIFTAPPVNGTANVTGVQATGQVGTVTASGDASNNLTGVQSTGTVGITTATGEANTGLTGVQSTGAVGTTTANGDGQTNLTGVQATGAVGIVTATGGGTGAGNAYVIGVEAIGSVGNVTANGGGYPVWPNGGLGYPFIIEPDRINPARNATANVKSAYILSAVGKVSAFGTIVINANVSVQAILHEIKINSMSARGIQNPTDEELIALLLMH